MADRPAKVERGGREHIPEDARHGSPGRAFTLWFAADPTTADHVKGVSSLQAFGTLGVPRPG